MQFIMYIGHLGTTSDLELQKSGGMQHVVQIIFTRNCNQPAFESVAAIKDN